MSIIKSTLYCGLIHHVAKLFPQKIINMPNLTTCILFQSYFIYNSGTLFMKSFTNNPTKLLTIRNDTLNLFNNLSGYFIYDIIYLLRNNPLLPSNMVFIIHHLIGMSMLEIARTYGAPKDMLKYYNGLCFVAEVTNPFINLRHFTRDTEYYKLNIKIIFYMYMIFRIILFPMVSYKFLTIMPSKNLKILFAIIYTMSLVWFGKIYSMYKKN